MNRKLPIIVYVAVFLIIAGVIIFSVFNSSSDTPAIKLPGSASEASGNDSSVIKVTPENVQTAISTLTRTNEYSREYYVTTMWGKGSSTASVKVWQDGDKLRISHKQDDLTKNIVFSDGKVHIWYSDSDKVYTSSLSDYGTSGYDRYARLIAYEELLSAPVESILDAGYEEKLGEYCIYAVYEGEDNNYVNRIYVSVNTGLLVAASAEENGKEIYSMSSVITTLATPDDEIFIPPSTKTT